MLNVIFEPTVINGGIHLNFSVTILPGSTVKQVLLFGVDTWDHDGYPDASTPTNFSVFTNPTPPPYGEQDVFKCCWIGKDSAFNNGTLSGFKVTIPTAPNEIQWFAYITEQGVPLPVAVTGWASNVNRPAAPKAPHITA
jgi:hypothetical protein